VTSPDPADPLDAALAVAEVFEARGISYAVGGALAFGLWGVPRSTVDVDFNVFVRPDDLGGVIAALESLGIVVDGDAARRASEVDGMFSVRMGRFRVDLFSASIDFAWEAERRRVKRKVEGRDLWFLSAESLAVFKLLFFRMKDVADLQRLIAVQGSRLDTDFVRTAVAGMLGEDDERIREWDALVRAHGVSS
jgi:hypothetical protein